MFRSRRQLCGGLVLRARVPQLDDGFLSPPWVMLLCFPQRHIRILVLVEYKVQDIIAEVMDSKTRGTCGMHFLFFSLTLEMVRNYYYKL